ncbi:GTP-binding protein [Clostridiaceae bacterium 35-E11]
MQQFDEAAIEHENKTIDAIGIVAINDEQVEFIEYNNYAMLDFVDKIAKLISTKVQEHEVLKQVRTYAELMTTVIDNINKGIVILNKNFVIMNINNYLVEKLWLTKHTLNDHAEVIKTSYSKIDDFKKIYKLQWHKPDMEGILLKKTLGISKYVLKFHPVNLEGLIDWLKEWTNEVYRVKGFCKIDGQYYFIKAVQGHIHAEKIDQEKKENFLVVLGPNRDEIKNKIKRSWVEKFETEIEIV